jgi:adenosylmethionine-8-amino-7-oxononanoate aminotransferase
LKNTGDAALVAPPFIAERKDIDMMVDILQKTVALL